MSDVEIKFAKDTTEKGYDTKAKLTKYLSWVIHASLAYGSATSVFFSWPNCTYRVGYFKVKIRAYDAALAGYDPNTNEFILKHRRKTVLDIGWKVSEKKDVELARVHYVDSKNLHLVTEFVKLLDADLMNMDVMMSSVI